MKAAAIKQAAAPGVFTFLKQGVVLPARRCGLFLRVFALNVVLGFALVLIKLLVVAPLVKPLNCGGNSAADLTTVAEGFTRAHAWGLLVGVAYIALYTTAWLLVKVATVSAAAAACSGERRTLASLLREASGGALPRAAAAYACGFFMMVACVAGVLFLAVPAALLSHHAYPSWLVLLGAAPALVGVVFYLYLDVVWDMAVVVSVAEKKHQAAVVCAWRLMRGTTARALLFAVVRRALHAAVGVAVGLAAGWCMTCCDDVEAGSDVAFVVGGVLAYVLHRGVRMFSAAALAAYYFECRKSKEVQDKGGHVD